MTSLRILDDRERELVFPAPPRRIVSLVPSDTHSLIALGVRDRLVGRTRYCVAPEGQVEDLPIVGGTKDSDADAIAALAPDLVIVNQEENARGPVGELVRRGLPVFVCFPRSVGAGVAHLARLVRILGLGGDAHARELLSRGARMVSTLEALVADEEESGRPRLSAFVPVWKDPLITGSAETFLSDALRLAGARNVFADRKRRYPLAADLGRAPELATADTDERDTRWPRIAESELIARAPELVLLPDEPYVFTEQDAAALRRLDLPAARSGRVRLCDGKDLSWYGAWSIDGVPRLRALVESLRGALA